MTCKLYVFQFQIREHRLEKLKDTQLMPVIIVDKAGG